MLALLLLTQDCEVKVCCALCTRSWSQSKAVVTCSRVLHTLAADGLQAVHARRFGDVMDDIDGFRSRTTPLLTFCLPLWPCRQVRGP